MLVATAQSPGVTSVSFSFVLKWTLKAKDLNDFLTKGKSSDEQILPVVRSDLYQFKNAKDLRFYLEIKDVLGGFQIYIKGSKMWSFKLAYAFLVSKERAIKLIDSSQLSFLPSYSACSVSDEEDVTIHCVVNARPAHPASSAKEDDLLLSGDQNTVDFEGMSDATFPINYKNEISINFILYGDIPYLTIDEAIKIINETKEHKCEALKIFYMEYLMKYISKHSMRQISKAALDYGLLHLQRRCLQLIASGDFQIKLP